MNIARECWPSSTEDIWTLRAYVYCPNPEIPIGHTRVDRKDVTLRHVLIGKSQLCGPKRMDSFHDSKTQKALLLLAGPHVLIWMLTYIAKNVGSKHVKIQTWTMSSRTVKLVLSPKIVASREVREKKNILRIRKEKS